MNDFHSYTLMQINDVNSLLFGLKLMINLYSATFTLTTEVRTGVMLSVSQSWPRSMMQQFQMLRLETVVQPLP